MSDLSNVEIKNDFISLINTIKPSKLVNEEVDKGINSLNKDLSYYYNDMIANKIYLSVYSEKIEKQKYIFNYQYEFE